MLLLILLFKSGMPAAPPVQLSGGTLLTPQQMRDDLAFVRLKILAQHPHPFLYTSAKEFDRLYHDIAQSLDRPLSRVEFYRRAAHLAASLRDGHTLVNPLIDDFQAYAATGGVIPFEIKFVDAQLYIASNDSGDPQLAPGTEITAINGISIPVLVKSYRELINDVHPIYDVYARLFR